MTVRNVATNAASDAASDANGRFLVINLAPGVYTVEVTLSGFAPYKRDNVIVEVGRTTTLDVGLGLAGQAETVQVTAESPIINTEQSDFSTNINQTTIANLPTNTRRWSTFALMTPGAAPDGNFGLVSFRGISGLLNNNTVDGGDNTQAFFAEERGRTRLAYSVSADAVREFQVTTSNYSAEYGRAAGGVVNAVTKSGTNELHGSGFYFLRDNKWGASNPFQTQTVLVDGVSTAVQLKPKDRRQQFGGTVGGPIQKDKVFFFFSYDQQARNFPGVAAPSNPTSFFAPFTAAELATFADARHYACAGRLTASTSCRSLTGVVPRTGDQTLFLPKIDWHRTTTIRSRSPTTGCAGTRPRACRPRPWSTAASRAGATTASNDDWTTARFNSVLGSRMTNEVHFQWGRDFEFQSSQEPIAGRAGVGAGADSRRSRSDRRRQISPSASRTSSSGARIPTSAGSISATCSRSRSGSHYLIRSARTSAACPTSSTACSRKPAPTATAAASTSSPTTRTCLRVSPRATTPASTRASGRPRSSSTPSTTTCSFRTPGSSIPRTTLNLGLRYDYEKMPEPQIANSLLAADVGLPEATRTTSGRASARRTTSAAMGAPSSAVATACSTAASSTRRSRTRSRTSGRRRVRSRLQLQTTSAGAPTLPECARERICHAGQARRRGLRRRHAEPAGARVGRHLRTAARCEHDGVGILRRQRRPQPAALHRREPSRSPRARSATPRSADLSMVRRSRRRSSPAHDRMRTSGASRRFRPWSTRSTTVSCCR